MNSLPVTQPAAIRVRRYLIAEDKSAAIETLAALEQIADRLASHPELREFTLAVIGDTGNNNVKSQVHRTYDWVRERLRYVRDPVGNEFVQSPLGLIRSIQTKGFAYGDCEDHVLLLNTMLGSMGIESRPVGVKLRNSNTYNHVISTVWMGGKWVDLDPCVKSGVQPNYTERLIYGG